MCSKIAIAALACFLIAFLPATSHAYFLPLVGAGSVLITMLIGLGAVLLSAGYLIFFKTRRMLRRWGKSSGDTPASSDSPSDKAP